MSCRPQTSSESLDVHTNVRPVGGTGPWEDEQEPQEAWASHLPPTFPGLAALPGSLLPPQHTGSPDGPWLPPCAHTQPQTRSQ